MKTIALDVGEKTIGLAVSDALGWTAQGLTTLRWTEGEYEDAFKQLEPYMKEHEVSKLVIGLPKNMNGTIGPRGEASQVFAEKSEAYFNVPSVLWDERLTTMAAERVLIDADVSRSKRKKVIDKMAAVMILQSYLDANSN
ncbi:MULTISPECIES: Holliday junction resolvase RuvX [Pontibacillus]|uniref:Putative pre-16S rRNA nuclease n=1 Tax=Pontibacillus chungwhensis TaxID=265426 RepID=A0ABY8UWC0_9BACI|nr:MULTISPECIES: Holliday junction resolvase RuvX [Pontibacillus]MCD5323669.1 Holliday junction resolvase RuvX [Pontibacillus sp. HN14]WIF97036.1 Holliday junction resolvase RuvX [Pontibacillus chungwhensis]